MEGYALVYFLYSFPSPRSRGLVGGDVYNDAVRQISHQERNAQFEFVRGRFAVDFLGADFSIGNQNAAYAGRVFHGHPPAHKRLEGPR